MILLSSFVTPPVRSRRERRTAQTALCAAASLFVLMPPATAFAPHQDEPTKTDAVPTPDERLVRTRADLASLVPHMDAETRALLPTLQVIVERVAVDPDNATETDVAIVKIIRQAARQLKGARGGGDFDPNAFLGSVKKKVGDAAQAKPVITSKERKVPGGGAAHIKGASKGRIGVVTLLMNGQEKTIAEVPSSAGGLTPGQRARKIAERIEAAKQANPLWYLSAKAGTTSSGSSVVTVDKAPGGYILTADAEFAQLRQTTPAKLAASLAADIRSTVDKPWAGRRAASDTPEQKEAAAVDCRVKGDAAYDKNDAAEAEAQYKAGIAANPNYVLLYERLAGLYDETGKKAERDAVVLRALQLPTVTAEQKKSLQGFHGG